MSLSEIDAYFRSWLVMPKPCNPRHRLNIKHFTLIMNYRCMHINCAKLPECMGTHLVSMGSQSDYLFSSRVTYDPFITGYQISRYTNNRKHDIFHPFNSSSLEKKPPFHRRDDIFRCIFVNEKFFIFDYMFSQVYSLGYNWQQPSICLDNGLVPNRWQTNIWTNAGPIHCRIYAVLGEIS